MKTRVGVIFGGLSVEHEVSVISAQQAMHAIDDNKYQVIPIYISKNHNWYSGDCLRDLQEYKNLKSLLNKADKVQLVRTEKNDFVLQKDPQPLLGKKFTSAIDVVFPITHGTFGEDGALQGYLEMIGIPYVGCDVLASALGMDKLAMKQVFADCQLPLVEYLWFYGSNWEKSSEKIIKDVEQKIHYPVIVKPANLGSSVGISKADNAEELQDAVELALSFANKVIVERMVVDMTELNCSVIGDFEHTEASVLEQVLGKDEFLTYEDKYQGGHSAKSSKGMHATNRIIPANISNELTKQIQELALKTFNVLGCSGVSRIDFLLDNKSQKVYVNEINTIPGSLSFYLWEASGKSFTELTTELIKLAFKRLRQREKLVYAIDSNLFNLQSIGKGGSSKGKL